MSQHHADFISSLFAERGRIRDEQGLLSKRMTAIDAVLLAYSDPGATISETAGELVAHGRESADHGSVATHGAAALQATNPGGENVAQSPAHAPEQPGHDNGSVRTPAEGGANSAAIQTPAQQPGSEAAVDDADAAPAGEAPSPVASPAPTSTRQRVKQLHDEHPEYTRREAWEALGITEGSLAGHSHALKIKWAPVEPVRFERPALVAPPEDSVAPDETVMPDVGLHLMRPQHPKKGTQFWLRDRDGQYLNRFCTAMTRVRKEAWTGTEAQVEGCRRAFDIARDLRDQPVEREGVQA